MADLEHQEDGVGRAYDARLVRRLLGYLWPYRRHVLAALALTTLAAPLVAAAPPLIRAAVDLYLAPGQAQPPSGYTLVLKEAAEALGFGGGAVAGLTFIALLLLAANLAAMLVLYAEALVLQRMGQYVMRDLRDEIFAHLHRLPLGYYDRNPVGRQMTLMTGDVETLNELFSSVVVAAFGDVAMILYILVWMFQVNWRLALVSSLVLPLMVALTVWFRLRSRAGYRRVRACVARINTFLQERLTGMAVVQLFSREESELETFRGINGAHRRANLDTIF
jgi:ATP-binding cassette subfamily B protein